MLQIRPSISDKLVICNLIDFPKELMSVEFMKVSKECQAEPEVGHKTTNTDGMYIREGRNKIAKKSENMLKIDAQLRN